MMVAAQTILHKARPVWLDCDPGHDDAIALLLALFAPDLSSSSSSSSTSLPALNLLGVSTVHGNAPGSSTYLNAVRLLSAYKIDPQKCRVWRGADVPIMRQAKTDVGIHGEGGLGGVECLPGLTDELVQRHMLQSAHSGEGSSATSMTLPPAAPLDLVHHLLELLKSRLKENLPPITLIATGPLTNIALLIKMCPGGDLALLKQMVENVVIMGGSAGVPGNRTPLAGESILKKRKEILAANRGDRLVMY